MVLGTENAADACVDAIAQADSSTGLFLWDFYKNTAQEVAVTRGMDLDMLLTELGEQGGSTVLPRIEKTEEGLSLGGGIALADGAYAFSLPAAEEQAHLLLLGEGSGAVIEGNWNGTVLPLEIRKDKVSFDFAKQKKGFPVRSMCRFPALSQAAADNPCWMEISDENWKISSGTS